MLDIAIAHGAQLRYREDESLGWVANLSWDARDGTERNVGAAGADLGEVLRHLSISAMVEGGARLFGRGPTT